MFFEQIVLSIVLRILLMFSPDLSCNGPASNGSFVPASLFSPVSCPQIPVISPFCPSGNCIICGCKLFRTRKAPHFEPTPVLIEELESSKAKEFVDFIGTDLENAIEKGLKVHHRCSTPSVSKDMLQNNSRLKKRLGRIFPPTPECAPLLDTGIFLESVFRNATDANDGCMKLESLKNSTYSFTFHPNLEDFSEAQKNAYIETCYKVQYDLLKQFEKIGIFKPTGKLEIKNTSRDKCPFILYHIQKARTPKLNLKKSQFYNKRKQAKQIVIKATGEELPKSFDLKCLVCGRKELQQCSVSGEAALINALHLSSKQRIGLRRFYMGRD